MGTCIGAPSGRVGRGKLDFITTNLHRESYFRLVFHGARRPLGLLPWPLVRALLFSWLGLSLVTLLAVDAGGAETNEVRATAAATPKTGSNLLGSFRIKNGFRIEVAASEPMVTAPVAMAFDENGRLFVVEMRGRDRRGANMGRVRMLDNMNDEGVYQNSTIYADNLTWPSAIACYAGGVFVAAAPDILYLKDTNNDGVADARQVVLTGLGGAEPSNPDLLPNNFNWGPDNRIHAASGGIGGELVIKDNANSSVSIAGSDFSFDPRTLEVFAEAG